jgi:hypothetical protein
MNEETVEVTLPVVSLEECRTDAIRVGTLQTRKEATQPDRIRDISARIRTDHMNDEERRLILMICEITMIYFTSQEIS